VNGPLYKLCTSKLSNCIPNCIYKVIGCSGERVMSAGSNELSRTILFTFYTTIEIIYVIEIIKGALYHCKMCSNRETSAIAVFQIINLIYSPNLKSVGHSCCRHGHKCHAF